MMADSRQKAPIYEMLIDHARRGAASFHVPGHKQRPVWGHEDADDRYEAVLALDVTELPDTDDLHHPSPDGAIEEAQRLAAVCFGAEETRFLVGGSTAGNLAMILGLTSPGDVVIAQRNVHRSVLHGFMLADVRAVLLTPQIEARSGLATIPREDDVRDALIRYPDAKAVILSTPNYYGMASDFTGIAARCHEKGIPLLVDEAHGPHFGRHPAFPRSALQAGADVVVQSAHKMLGAMTMGAMLHMQGELADREAIRQALRMVQSSSPSFPLLASLDLARRQVEVGGEAAFGPALAAAETVRAILPETTFGMLEGPGQDPLKLALYEKDGRCSGFRLRDLLADRGCLPEMADDRYVVMALGIGSTRGDGERLARMLIDLSKELGRQEPLERQSLAAYPEMEWAIPEPVPFRRHRQPVVSVPLEASIGETAGEWIVPYPPGIPELFPGETITPAAVRRLHAWRQQGAVIQGAEDPTLTTIRVWQK